MNKNGQGKSVRDQIIALKEEREQAKTEIENIKQHNGHTIDIELRNKRITEINRMIDNLKLHLGKTDQKIEKLKIKEKLAESENNQELADLLHMQKYILRLGKHIEHLIESVESDDPDRASQHFHRLESRIKNILDLSTDYDKKYR